MSGQIELKAVKPEKALEYWKTRRPLTDAERRTLADEGRSRALTVAGLANQAQLSAVYRALEKALDEGTTLADFKKDLGALIEEQGWGAWRIENIFRTNLAAAYAAGAWAEIEANKEAFPYLEYLAVGDDRTRPAHAVLNGKVYSVDHEFWARNYPPNGYGCRCDTVPVSRWRAESKGVKIESDMPGTLIYKGENGYPIPVAAPGADRGFVGNVGKDWFSGLTPSELTEALSFGPARTVCPVGGNFANTPGPCGLPLANIDPKHILPVKTGDILPSNKSETFYALEFLKAFGINDLNGRAMVTIMGGSLILPVSKDLLIDHKTGVLKANKNGRGPYMRLLAETIKNPFEIWRVPAQLAGRPCDVLRLVRLFREPNGKSIGGFGVFNWIVGRGWQGASVFTPKTGEAEKVILNYLDRQRVGNLLYREK